MFAKGRVFATVAVKDLVTARVFYGITLGLEQIDENIGGVTYESGGGRLFVYRSPTAGTNQATSAYWEVDDIEAVVEELRQKGIIFEHYDLPETHYEGDIAVMGQMKTAWFKDPDGNILGVGSITTE
jgi:extradiol dioxygenase family protein